MLRRFSDSLSVQIDTFTSNLRVYLRENTGLIFVFSAIALAAYGFELFNFNLTIDEEISASFTGPTTAWISQGRWGMYILNKFLLPYNVIPFVPLFVALAFHLGAILLILNSFEIKGKFEQIVIGSIGISFPGMAYMYTFSTINYGVGIGLFCVALSLFIYVKNSGLRKFWAVIPAAFSISIYQGFIPALLSVFLLYIIKVWGETNLPKIRTLINISSINLLAIIVYYVTQKFILVVARIPATGYVDQYFDIGYLRHNFSGVLASLSSFLLHVYLGDKSIYAIEMPIFGVLLIALSLGLIANLLRSNLTIVNKVLVLFFSLGFLLMPFVSGFLTRGYLAMRFLVGLPIVIMGWTMLGIGNNPRFFKIFVSLLVGFCIFQFVISTNHLFASSYLALQEDRLLASSLIERIEDAKAEHGTKSLKYIEMIGYLNRPSTELIPKIETFGASFFAWDQGNVWRVIFFLQTVGYQDLQPLSLDRRPPMVEIANAMPNWPEKGSVVVINDVALIRFGPYSDAQKQQICASRQNQVFLQNQDFCK